MKPWNIVGRLRRRSRILSQIVRALKLFVPMCQDVVKGRYRPPPWSAFGWMLVALAYLVSPLDLIPDWLLLIGVFDDMVIVGWLLTRVDRSLDGYRAWRGKPIEGKGDDEEQL
ncbi:YkvA family protein [Billgrantia diversa]|uniref:YkvA family protein n=1 Tax=Halomonas sp. MCCC 1A13316 TaxID=2733487 RepID=UPI001E2C2A66|nr:DUF1232 domain-containing protein [Halomonas sp. MCCC 1A13316]